MRFKEFLTERAIDMSVKELIERDCKSFLEQANGHLLWRGSKTLHKSEDTLITTEGYTVYKTRPRPYRKPRNTSVKSSAIIDNYFHDKFGWKPRSEAVFCFGEPKGTTFYGTTYCIFPIGDFKYVWSPVYDDLFGSLPSTFTLINDSLPPTVQYEREEELLQRMDAGKYQDTDLDKALQYKHGYHEIMLKCKEYYAIDYRVAVQVFNLSDD